MITETARFFLQHNSAEIKEELLNARRYDPVDKDILIVVHDQYECVRACLDSIARNTQRYRLYIWDNGSQEKTAEYLRSVGADYLHRSEANQGFIIPNNCMAAMGSSPFVILLNSDTVVRPGWDETLIAWLQTHPDTAAVACMGGLLGENMVGCGVGAGYNVDYLCGWGLCFSRCLYREFGLFDDEHLAFAYGEDSDFSLRLKEAGKRIYAMHADLVLHLGAKTSTTVMNERDMQSTFDANHAYLAERWKRYRRIGGG